MQNRRNFLKATVFLSGCATIAASLKEVSAASLPALSENTLIENMEPSVWVSWGKIDFPDAQGATDRNVSGYLQVGFQYHTFTLLPYALVHRNLHFLDGVCSIAEYAFRHQREDGSFEYRESNGVEASGAVPNPEAPASSLTLFFYDFGHTLLVLADNAWFSSAAECAPYRERLRALRPKIALALNWLLTQRDLLATDRAATDRTLAHGLAYYFIGKVVDRSDAVSEGRAIVLGALAGTANGVFPEAGGFDSSYQAINILECQWLYLHSEADSILRSRLWDSIVGGIARERESISSTGEISTVGDTRVRSNGETYFGHTKTVNAREVMLAFAYYGAMARDQTASALVPQIQRRYALATQ